MTQLDWAGQTECDPSGKKTGQEVVVFHTGKMMTPLTVVEEESFFQVAINLPMGGQMKRHSPDQSKEKASVAKERG